MSNCVSWWTLWQHKWRYSTDDEARELLRGAQDATSRLFVGTFEAREVRTCSRCGRSEQRDVYGGNYMPHGWQLRKYGIS